MSELEKQALDRCEGKVLDVGAGAGVHAKVLSDNGHDVFAIDISKGAVTYMQSKGIKSDKVAFMNMKDQTPNG